MGRKPIRHLSPDELLARFERSADLQHVSLRDELALLERGLRDFSERPNFDPIKLEMMQRRIEEIRRLLGE